MLKNILIMVLVLVPALGNASDVRIINGTEVDSSNVEWKTIVALKWQGNAYCGGTLIAPTWVLTAAHCVIDSYGNAWEAMEGDTVGVGSYNINTMESYNIKSFIVHEAYDSSTFDNDIGLVELETAVSTIVPIVYDTTHSLIANTQTKVAGWGNMNSDATDTAEYPTNLMEALVPIIDTSVCNSGISYNGEITENMFCAGYMESTRDSCQGDSGGPLIVDNTLVGIVSWGYGCAQENLPGVYTKVQNYTEWIREYVPYSPNNQTITPVVTFLLF